MAESLATDPDFVSEQYRGTQEQARVAEIPGGTAISSLNGLSGPTVTLSGGTTGYSFSVAAPTVTLTVSSAATVRSSISAAASGVNTDITQLNGASQVDVTASYKKSGTQVVAGRKTGWGSPAGTLLRSAYSGMTAAALPVGAAYTQAEVEALRDAVVVLSQTVAALLTDLHGGTSGHGLIGA